MEFDGTKPCWHWTSVPCPGSWDCTWGRGNVIIVIQVRGDINEIMVSWLLSEIISSLQNKQFCGFIFREIQCLTSWISTHDLAQTPNISYNLAVDGLSPDYGKLIWGGVKMTHHLYWFHQNCLQTKHNEDQLKPGSSNAIKK